MSRLLLRGLRCHLLDPVDLALEEGECVVISGPSGSGKSVLLRAIADLDEQGGEMYLDGLGHRSFSGPEWRRQVGLLPAESHWWRDRVAEHMAADVNDLLQQMGFTAECLDWSVQRLSSGERQRLALVRLLAGAPKVLLLDEPTANLDAGSARRVEACVADYRSRSGAAVLWVSHDPEQRRRVAARGLVIRGRGLEPAGES